MPEHAEVELLLPAYVLGALSDQELEDVEVHLAECPICQGDVAALMRLTSTLPLIVPQVDPPASLAGRLRTEATRETAPAPARPMLLPVERSAATHPAAGPRVVRIPVYWAAAAAMLPLLLSGWLVYQVVGMRRSMDSMQVAAQQAWNSAEMVTDIMGRGIMTGAGAASVDGTENAPEASGMLYYLPSHEDGVLVVDGLPDLPRGQCYQVWLISGDKWMNGGTFYLGGDGKGIVVVKSPMPLAAVDTVRVTMEPHGGSEEPRGNRYLWARLKTI